MSECEFAQPVHVFSGSGKSIRPSPSGNPVGCSLGLWGVGPSYAPVRSMYNQSQSLVRIAGS